MIALQSSVLSQTMILQLKALCSFTSQWLQHLFGMRSLTFICPAAQLWMYQIQLLSPKNWLWLHHWPWVIIQPQQFSCCLATVMSRQIRQKCTLTSRFSLFLRPKRWVLYAHHIFWWRCTFSLNFWGSSRHWSSLYVQRIFQVDWCIKCWGSASLTKHSNLLSCQACRSEIAKEQRLPVYCQVGLSRRTTKWPSCQCLSIVNWISSAPLVGCISHK